MSGTDITQHPIHLGRGATAVIEPAFTGNYRRSRHTTPGALVRRRRDGEPRALGSIHSGNGALARA